MSERIVIDPVTRIEGHAKITIHLDDQGAVKDARFHVTEFRGFEKFCEGRSFREMPVITARICGICPISHLMASAKATDNLLAVEIPETAKKLRKLVNLGQLVQSHALSFFHLSSPDFLLSYDAEPSRRNILALAETHPQIALDGIRLRKWGQEIIETVAGKRIHPAWAVPGGVARPLSEEGRQKIMDGYAEALAIAQRTLAAWKRVLDAHQEEARTFGNFPSLFMGMVDEEGALDHTYGKLRFVDEGGEIVADQIDPVDYDKWIGEAVEPDSYLKSPYFLKQGYPNGMYRVGPLARLNVAKRCGTPLADTELAEFRQLGRGAVLSSFHYHYARLIENPLRRGDDRRAARRLGHPLHRRVRAGHAQPDPRRGGQRGAARHPLPRLRGAAGRPPHPRQPGDRHRPEQPGHEQDGGPDRPPLRGRPQAQGGHAQPRRGRDPLLRPLPLLLDARGRQDADAGGAGLAGRRAARPRRAVGARMALLALALGTPLRGDDGAGAAMARGLAALLPGLEVIETSELLPEHAEAVAQADGVLFLDASISGAPGEVQATRLAPRVARAAILHALMPEEILGLAQSLYGCAPPAGMVTIAGREFGFGEALSAEVEAALPAAREQARALADGFGQVGR
ncbi:MAG: hydrogenase maturation protease [Anaeromyxobacter sp.]